MSIEDIYRLTGIDPVVSRQPARKSSSWKTSCAGSSRSPTSTMRSCGGRSSPAFPTGNWPRSLAPAKAKFVPIASDAASWPRSNRSTPAPPSSRPTRPTTIRPTKMKTKRPPSAAASSASWCWGVGRTASGRESSSTIAAATPALRLRELGIESIMVNSNPETVSTDYDTSDLLFFEPLTTEDVLNICDRVQPDGVIVQFGGQTPLNLARALATCGVPIIGTSVDTIEDAEDREKFQRLLHRLDLRQPANGIARTMDEARAEGGQGRLSGAGAAQLRAGRSGDGNLLRPSAVRTLRGRGVSRRPGTAGADRPVSGRRHRGRRRCRRRRRAARSSPASWNISKRRAYTRAIRPAPCRPTACPAPCLAEIRDATEKLARQMQVKGLDEHPVRRQERGRAAERLRARGESSRQPHDAVCLEGHRHAAGQGRGQDHGRRIAGRARLRIRSDSQPRIGQGKRVSRSSSSPASTSCWVPRCVRPAK